jgi:hypothetical protein
MSRYMTASAAARANIYALAFNLGVGGAKPFRFSETN